MRLIAEGDLPSGRLPGSSHHRLPVDGVLALMQRRESAHQRLDEATRALDEAGVDSERRRDGGSSAEPLDLFRASHDLVALDRSALWRSSRGSRRRNT